MPVRAGSTKTLITKNFVNMKVVAGTEDNEDLRNERDELRECFNFRGELLD